VFAIGGMARGDMRSAWEAGAHGIAAIRSAWA
jgi:thiamine monophosphate synthase